MTESNVVSATTWLSTTNKYTKRVDLENTEEWRREHPEIIEESAPAVADEALSTTTPSPTTAEDNETSQEITAGWYKNPVIWILIIVVLAGLLPVYNKKKKDQK